MSFSAARELATEQIPGQPAQLAFGGHLRKVIQQQSVNYGGEPNMKATNRKETTLDSPFCVCTSSASSLLYLR